VIELDLHRPTRCGIALALCLLFDLGWILLVAWR